MKRLCILVILILLLSFIFASDTVKLSVGLDSALIDAIWRNHVELRFSFDLISEIGIGVRLPLSLLIDRSGGNEILLESGVTLLYFPWLKGPFISLSLAHLSAFIGPYAPEQRFHYLSEIEVGYRWEFLPHFYIAPSLLYRDPSLSDSDAHQYIQDFIPSYSKLAVALNVGWNFLTITPRL